MSYVSPGNSGLLTPSGPVLPFPLGGYTADVFSDDVALGHGWDYTPSAVTHQFRPVGLLYLPDASRAADPMPARGWPVLHINAGGGWQTLLPRYNVVPDEVTSNIAFEALEAGWAVWWTGINGPAGSLPAGVLGHGTEDIPWTGTALPVDYRHFDGPGSTPLNGGTEYEHDQYLSYLKQSAWSVQWLREKIASGDWAFLNADMIASAGTSAGAKNAYWQVCGPDLQDTGMADFRRQSSRTELGISLVQPWFEPALLWNEGNVYGYPWPLASDPLNADCSSAGWLSAGAPNGLLLPVEMSAQAFSLSNWAGRFPGAPTHEELVARTATRPMYVVSSKAETFNYGATNPSQWCLMNGVGSARSLVATNLMTAVGAGTGHSPAWQVQMAQALHELDGSTDPSGFHRTHSRFILDEARLAELAGHTTTTDGNAPYAAIPLADLISDTIQNVEEVVDGQTEGFLGYVGKDAIAWLGAQAEFLRPGFQTPSNPVVVRQPDRLGHDVALFPPKAAGGKGLTQLGQADLIRDPGLATAVLVSMFTDRRLDASEALPLGAGSRRGYWADSALDRAGSGLWRLARMTATAETASRARAWTLEALDWLIEDGILEAVEVDAAWEGERLCVEVRLRRGRAQRFAAWWSGTGGTQYESDDLNIEVVPVDPA